MSIGEIVTRRVCSLFVLSYRVGVLPGTTIPWRSHRDRIEAIWWRCHILSLAVYIFHNIHEVCPKYYYYDWLVKYCIYTTVYCYCTVYILLSSVQRDPPNRWLSTPPCSPPTSNFLHHSHVFVFFSCILPPKSITS